MTYDLYESSTAEGRPYFLYLFAENAVAWRFTSRASDWTSPAGAIADETEDLVWTASAVSHGPVVQSSDPRRVDLSLAFGALHPDLDPPVLVVVRREHAEPAAFPWREASGPRELNLDDRDHAQEDRGHVGEKALHRRSCAAAGGRERASSIDGAVASAAGKLPGSRSK